jgi:hypothetical protein
VTAMDNVIRNYFPPFGAQKANAIGAALKVTLSRTTKMLVKYCGEEETEALLKVELENIKRQAR